MHKFMINSLILLVVFLLFSDAKAADFQHFISVKGDQLYDGDQPFRFISYNIPNLLTVEDNMSFRETNAWRLPDAFEIEDALQTVKMVGGKVARTYVITVRRKTDEAGVTKFVEAPGKFNERAFKTLDSALVIANKTGVRLIIPLVDNWKWMGGKPQYAQFRDKNEDAFWTEAQLKNDFKKTIDFILNRVNTVSGVPYREDKAVLAWELGNELNGAPLAWIVGMAKYIKSIDKNHLINDGVQTSNISDELVNCAAIDILSSHHYENNLDEMLMHIRECAAKAKGKKPYYVGEFGFISTTGINAVLDLVDQTPHIAGAMIWSLRFHNREGGFYWHSEPLGNGLYKAYHWPGFVSGEAYDETNVMALVQKYACQIDHKKIPAAPVPDTPRLLDIRDVAAISWQGSAGAEYYCIERAGTASGPWNVIAPRVVDAAAAYAPLFNDASAEIGQSYFYRVRAVSQSGVSEPSNVAGPVVCRRQTLVDELQNVAGLYHFTGDVRIETNSARVYKEDFHRLAGKKGVTVIYHVAQEMKEFTVYAYSPDDQADLDMSVSENGSDFKPVKMQVASYFKGKMDYGYAYPFLYSGQIEAGAIRYLKIHFRDESQIGRVEVQYGN